jgi:DNA-binding XRE family transcriptional regulator
MKKQDNTFKGYLKEKLRNKTFREAHEHYVAVLEIGMRVRKLREGAGLTQAELARKMGVSQQTISRLESGEVDNPTVATLERIARATGHQLRVDFEPA